MSDVLQKTADIHPHRGVLDPDGFNHYMDLQRISPPAKLAGFVDHFWILKWNMSGDDEHQSLQILPEPATHLFFAINQAAIQGVYTARNTYVAQRTGKIAGVQFRPGGLYPFYRQPVSKLTDKITDAAELFPEVNASLANALLAHDDDTIVRDLAAPLLKKLPQPDPNIALIAEIIKVIEQDRTIQTVDEIAHQFHKSDRRLQYLFQTYVGVGLKWVIRRQRILDAAEYARTLLTPDWAMIALDLGYNSQPHFITDFKNIIGQSPSQYMKLSQQPKKE